MSEIRRYVLVDLDGQEQDHEYPSLAEAQSFASRHDNAGRYAVFAHVYVFDESELVWTPNGHVWPPTRPTANERLDTAAEEHGWHVQGKWDGPLYDKGDRTVHVIMSEGQPIGARVRTPEVRHSITGKGERLVQNIIAELEA